MNSAAKKSSASGAVKVLKKYGIVVVLLLLIVVLSIASPNFFTLSNILNAFGQSAIFGIMAIGLTFVIISKGIDLSVASILAFTGVVTASLSQQMDATGKVFPDMQPWPFFIVLIVGLLMGAILGAINGAFIAKTHIPPFIATLGMMTIASGFALIYTSGKPVSTLDPAYEFVGGKLWDVIPVPVLIWAIVAAIAWVLLNHTRFGKSVFAIGANSTAAEISGINVDRNIIIIYAISGLLAALAGIVTNGRTLSAHPSAQKGGELTAIAATTIGGTSQTGGIGTIWGAIVGALILGFVRNGLVVLGINPYWQGIVEGAIIIGAVIIDMRKNYAKK